MGLCKILSDRNISVQGFVGDPVIQDAILVSITYYTVCKKKSRLIYLYTFLKEKQLLISNFKVGKKFAYLMLLTVALISCEMY